MVDFTFLTIDEISTPRSSVVRVHKDQWWMIDNYSRVALYVRNGQEYPQCNGNEELANVLGQGYPWCVGVVKIPYAFTVYHEMTA